MERNYEHENACEHYLLGELSEQEQEQLEEAYFTDDVLFERFLAVKDDLIDAYARGDLDGEKRERFEHHFLASQPRQQRVEEARGFIRAVTAHSSKASTVSTAAVAPVSDIRWRRFISETSMLRPWVWQGALAVLLLVALASVWLLAKRLQGERAEVVPPVGENRRDLAGNKPAVLNGSVSPTKPTATSTPDHTSPTKPANKKSAQPVPVVLASLVLSPFSPRDATGSNSLVLRPDTTAVGLRLDFKGDGYRRYHVSLRTLDGEQVLYRNALKARSSGQGQSVTLTFDPLILRRQDYIITLSGLTADGKLEAIGDYYFRVERSAPQSTIPHRR